MKVDSITLKNFRQYFGTNKIDLSTSEEKNIVLIGGRNGYGKTNFLLSLVWCLYGEDIVKIDDNFKKEIQKEGNYSKFLKSCLNNDASKASEEKFSVEIKISGIELPETKDTKAGSNYLCILKRTFDTSSSAEDFEIDIQGIGSSLFADNDFKRFFVSDYIIPVEAAKFVFFDAEKIASWAELSTKEEGSVLNDALGKILGLDIYESLINDLKIYTDSLRKESATSQVRQQITTTEKGIEINIEKISDFENDIIVTEKAIIKLRQDITEYEVFLIKHGNTIPNTISLEELFKTRNELYKKEKGLEDKFHELTEIIPFAIAGGILEEVNEHLIKQEEDSSFKEKRLELIEKNNELLEKLFNNPPYPSDGDMSFSKKMFYADKAKKIVEEVFGKVEDSTELSFEHDLTNSDRELIVKTFIHIRKQTRDVFEQTIDSFNRVKNDIIEIERDIKKIESDQQDEEIIKYTNNKSEAERKIEKLIEEKGARQNQKEFLKKENEKLIQSLSILLKKVDVSVQKKKKLDKANQYILALESFVVEQKRKKCHLLEKIIFENLNILMHKTNFIGAVKAETLPDNDGLKITLYDCDGNIRQKESGLSQGEKQLYISCLIKSILTLSIQELPIFIDTPLSRLDSEHIENILKNYYPSLSSQVVLMATNNEISPSRYNLIKENVSKTYLLDSVNNKTIFKQGYFKNYAN